MNDSSDQRKTVPPERSFEWIHPKTGRIAASENAGQILVEYDGNEPVAARVLSGISRLELASKKSVGREILLVFDGGNPARPIIVGVLENVLESLVSLEVEEGGQAVTDVVVDGERTVIAAQNEVVLKCGEGSITIKKEGRIVIRGTEIVSRASGSNKIKGGSVELN